MSDTTTNVIVPNPTLAALLAALPAPGETYQDVAFGETVMRITDVAAEAPSLDAIVVEYFSTPGDNSDSSVIRLLGTGTGGNQRFYARQPDDTWVFSKSKSMLQRGPSTFWWHPNNPDLAYTCAVPNNLWNYVYSTNSQTLVKNFDGVYSNVEDGGENGLSNDGSKIALLGDNDIFIYNFDTDSIVASAPFLGQNFGGYVPVTFKELRISGDGLRLYVSAHGAVPSAYTNHLFFFEDDGVGGLTFLPCAQTSGGPVHFSGYGGGHRDSATAPDGKDYLFVVESQNTNKIFRVAFDDASYQTLRTGTWPGWGNNGGPSSGTSLLASSVSRDGQVFVIFYSTPNMGVPGSSWGYYQHEIFSSQYDGSGPVIRYTHNRAESVDSGGTDYYKVPKGWVLRDGTQLIFNSDMSEGSDNYADVWALLLSPTAQAASRPPDGNYRLVLS